MHGGGYALGSSATPLYDGAALARRGCVFVSANYRLGPLGALDLSSLSTKDTRIDTNLSLRDLVLALQWVKDNIAAFGGDPDNVTIFGESGGAHAVATLLAVPAARGLFAQVISQSPAMGLVRDADAAAAFAARFAAILAADAGDAATAVKRAEPGQLVAAFHQLTDEAVRDVPGFFAHGPTIDSEFLPRDPVEAMARGDAHRVPLIIGNNADEGRLFTRFLKVMPTSQPHIEQLLADVDAAAKERINVAYPNYPQSDACVRIGGDMCFDSIVWQIAEAHSKHAPTHVYRYDYVPRSLSWTGLGATTALSCWRSSAPIAAR